MNSTLHRSPQPLTGFIPNTQRKDHWWMGSGKARVVFGAQELMAQGHGWKKHLPEKEVQKKNGVETSFCTAYGTANAFETLARFHGFDLPANFAERYNGIIAKITRDGGSPHEVAETFRTFGVISETLLPFADDIRTWEQYASPNPMLEEFLTLGQSVLRKYRFGHEFIHYSEEQFTPGKIIAALGRGTVCASVDAWNKGKAGIYQKEGPDGHWVQVVDYVENDHWFLYDSYEPALKKYEWDARFFQAKLYFLDRNPSNALPHEIDYLKYLLRTGQFAQVIPWIARNLTR